MTTKGRTLREAIRVAIEVLPGPPTDWAHSKGADRKAMRTHVVAWIQDYAQVRGVLLERHDIEPELDAALAELRERAT